MENKLRLWEEHSSWEEAENIWDQASAQAAHSQPLKGIKHLPEMVGITPETAHGLKWKSFKWMISKDHKREVLKGFLKRPLHYGFRYLQSLWGKKSFRRDGDFFLYGLQSIEQFHELLKDKDNLFVIGFSYCHKPFECPSGRFTDQCIHSLESPVCQQCFIGKALHALPKERTIPLLIPTVHYIGGKIFEIIEQHPKKQVIFLITACEMTLEMFGDWGNMVGIKGLGVRLGGRICNTMKAFELSETGIKPGLTVVLDNTQRQILEMIRIRRDLSGKGTGRGTGTK